MVWYRYLGPLLTDSLCSHGQDHFSSRESELSSASSTLLSRLERIGIGEPGRSNMITRNPNQVSPQAKCHQNENFSILSYLLYRAHFSGNVQVVWKVLQPSKPVHYAFQASPFHPQLMVPYYVLHCSLNFSQATE
jgi:hypothetical protein